MKVNYLYIFLVLLSWVEANNSAPPYKLSPEQTVRTYPTIEFIYWKFTAHNLAYGRDGVGLTNSPTPQQIPVTATGTSFHPDFKYNPGMKLGWGFKFGEGFAFDVYLRYIWLHSNPKGSITASQCSPSFLPLNWLTSNSLSSAIYSKASEHLKLYFQWAEVQSGYTFRINQNLSLRPFMALTGIVIQGDLFANYAFTPPSSEFTEAKTHSHSFSWSIGPKIGLDFTLMPLQGFGIFTNVNFSQQAVQLYQRTKQIDSFPTQGSSFVIQKGALQQIRSVSLLGLEIGPFWEQWVSNHRYRLLLRATWQTSTIGEQHLSFLNNNNVSLGVGTDLRGFNIRFLFEW